MISFDRFRLNNGMRVIVHRDDSTPMAVVNVLYDVGARDEHPDKTGFAHLFEHLMFGGSINIPDYDEPLQNAGGDNNAFTTNDLTNYYCQLPAENIETAFWLESDRMLSLAFDAESLEVQRKVVSEEFKEHYINKPYGDVWHNLRRLAYTQHPYRWMTIGDNLAHIQDATLDDVKAFFAKHYNPSNAILVVAGNVTTEQVKALAEKWFAPIPAGVKYERNLPVEPEQQQAREKEMYAQVPLNAIYKCWHMSNRTSRRYYVAEFITEILGGGKSSRLFQALVKDRQLFSSIACYHDGSTDEGLLVIEGKLVHGTTMQQANRAIEEQLEILIQQGIVESELEKVKNKTESLMEFEDMGIMNRATSLAIYELLGDADLINKELDIYRSVTAVEIQEEAARLFKHTNSNTLYYHAKTEELTTAH